MADPEGSTEGPARDTTAGTPPSQRLVRRLAEKKIAGVAAGLGDYFGVDPIWIRLAFILLSIGVGSGILLYLALWIVMPATEEPSTAPRRGPRELMSSFGSTWPGTVAIAIGVLIVGTQLFERRPGLFWGTALIVLGVLLFRDREEVPAVPPVEPVSLPARDTPRPPPVPSAPPPVPRRNRRERSPLGLLTLGATLVVVGMMWFLNLSAGVSIRLDQYLAAALTVIGIGLLVGVWWGRARWLVLPGLVLVPAVVLASLITVPFEGGHGFTSYRPREVAALEPEYRQATGRIRLDLSGLRNQRVSDPTAVQITIALGAIEVYIPEGMAVDLRARAGTGSVEIQGLGTAGFDVDERRRYGPAEAIPIELDLQVSIGTINVWEFER